MIDKVTMATAIAVLMACIAALVFSELRRQRSKFELRLLDVANDSLRAHFKALRQLDDPAMPAELIEVAMHVSRILTNRETVHTVIEALASRRNDAVDTSADEARILGLYDALAKHRPDLATAFTQVATTGLLSATARWPDTFAALQALALDVVVEPVDETMKVVRFAKCREQTSFPRLIRVPA